MAFDLKFFWRLAVRRSPAMMALFLLCSGIGVALAVKLPTTYESIARLLVEPPQITSDSDVGGIRGEAAQLEVIQQRLMTRANMIDIANTRNVFGKDHGMTADQMFEAMQDATNINRSAGRGRATFMSISFSASSGRTAAAVVNDYVTLVLQENARLRTGQVGDTLDFFKQEVTRLSAELNQQSQRILEFKAANADALPDSLNYRLSRQGFLQERIARLEREIAGQKEQRARVVAVYEATGSLRQTAPEETLTPQERELRSMQGDLENALAIYSDTNPKVVLLKNRIAGMEARIAAQAPAPSDPANPDAATVQRDSIFDINLAQFDSQIEQSEQELASSETEMADVSGSIERTAGNQITLESLDRDYANLQRQYNQAVERANQASMGERIEAGNKGQRITVIEPANVPNAPSSPNRPVIAAAGIGAGLASMVGLFLLLELLNRAPRRPAELISALGITPLSTIPFMESRRHKWARRSFQVVSLLVVIVGVPAGLWAIDQYYLPLDLLVQRVIDKLGFL